MSGWRYPAPYDIYDEDEVTCGDGRLAIVEDGELVGFCSFGADGRVPGGRYPEGPLDVGMGMRPELTGRGLGARYLAAVLAFARCLLGATRFRVTAADFNARALRLCEQAGFRRIERFEGKDRAFWILVRED